MLDQFEKKLTHPLEQYNFFSKVEMQYHSREDVVENNLIPIHGWETRPIIDFRLPSLEVTPED